MFPKMLASATFIYCSTVAIIVLFPTNSLTLEHFPGRPNQTYMIQQFGRNLVWEPKDGELATGTQIVLSPLDPTNLAQFWTTRDVPGFGVLLFNAAAPNWVVADWSGVEGYNATLRLSREFSSSSSWSAYAGDMDSPPFAIYAMSPEHYRVHGQKVGLPLMLYPSSSGPLQQWVVNRTFSPPEF